MLTRVSSRRHRMKITVGCLSECAEYLLPSLGSKGDFGERQTTIVQVRRKSTPSLDLGTHWTCMWLGGVNWRHSHMRIDLCLLRDPPMLPAGYRNRITASPFSPDLFGECMRHFLVYSGLHAINYAYYTCIVSHRWYLSTSGNGCWFAPSVGST